MTNLHTSRRARNFKGHTHLRSSIAVRCYYTTNVYRSKTPRVLSNGCTRKRVANKPYVPNAARFYRARWQLDVDVVTFLFS